MISPDTTGHFFFIERINVVAIPQIGDKGAKLIHDVYKRDVDDWRRPHLGASVIGNECSRQLWYGFRWASKKEFPGRMLRLFKRGHKEEDWVAEDLIRAGIALQTIDPETGEQWVFSWFGGHFGGSCDGLGTGFPEAKKAIHVFECKSSNTKYFKEMVKKKVKEAKPEHYAQMQTYMHGAIERGIKARRAYYVMVCKETDDIYTERVVYDKAEAEAIIHKARLIISSNNPLSKISEDPTWYKCNFCDYNSICHLEKVENLERNCRTCLSSTPMDDGSWHCQLLDESVDTDEQRKGCADHLFIPTLLPWDAINADKEYRAITYEDRNGVKFVDSGLELTVQEETK